MLIFKFVKNFSKKVFLLRLISKKCELILLKETGMKVSISDLLQKSHKLVEYAKKNFPFVGISYLAIWHKIFLAPRNKVRSNVLLLFAVPVSNAKLERLFHKMKHVKTNLLVPWCQTFGKYFENYGWG